MSASFAPPSPWPRLKRIFGGFDGPLLLAMTLLAAVGLVAMYSAGYDHGTRFFDHGRHMLIAFGILFLVAQIPPQRLMSLAVPLYVIGVILLVAVEFAGVTKKGATRWLNVGVVIQPSEMLKIDQNGSARQQWQEETAGRGSIEAYFADLLSKQLDVKPSRESNVINITYKSAEPQFAAVIANAFAQAYFDTNVELRVISMLVSKKKLPANRPVSSSRSSILLTLILWGVLL